jgi:methylmalonyl-CoA mutase C-terminal domain/subunit
MTIFPKILKLLKERKANIPVIGGGIIPLDDVKKLEKMGVKKIFGPGTPTSEIVEWINNNVKEKVKTIKGKQKKPKRRK